ncbi:MAG: hypothetical protein HY542_01605 [Deltaproteobacteria bacterium]|nr:hypothetical protein [Deltaproteobacteria bacterium]
MSLEQKVDEVLGIVREEHKLNNVRFTQLSTSMIELDKRMKRLESGVSESEKRLDQKIENAFSALSEDVQVFAGDLEKVNHKDNRLERKFA